MIGYEAGYGGDEPSEPRGLTTRTLVGFASLLLVYQASEGLQTFIAPSNPLGPALMVAMLLLAWPVGRWMGWRGYDAYGLDLQRRSLSLLASGLLLAGLAFLASRALGFAGGVYGPPTAGTFASLPLTISLALITTFIPSVAEDILTRGFLLRTFRLRLSPATYVVGSALLYTANHIWRLDWGISEQIRLFCLGLAYGAAAWRWRTLWGAVSLHWGWNLANVLAAQLMPVDTLQADAARYLSAIVHLILLAIILLAPAPGGNRERATL